MNLKPEDRAPALNRLQAAATTDIVAAVARPADNWGVMQEERVALVEYLLGEEMPSSNPTHQPTSSSYAYSILQYVPDPVRNERINIGVLVAADAGDFFGARVLPKSKFGRILRFGYGGDDLTFLSEFAAQLKRDSFTAPSLSGAGASPWNAEALARASTDWGNTLQVTPPRPVLHERPRNLVNDLYRRFVEDPTPTRKMPRDRRWITKRITGTLREAVKSRRPEIDPTEHVKTDVRFQGGLQEHFFDVELMNGRPLDLVRSISFEAAEGKVLQNEIDAVAWAIDDLRNVAGAPPVTVASIGEGKVLDSAESVYASLGATVVRETGLDRWLEQASGRLLLSLTSG